MRTLRTVARLMITGALCTAGFVLQAHAQDNPDLLDIPVGVNVGATADASDFMSIHVDDTALNYARNYFASGYNFQGLGPGVEGAVTLTLYEPSKVNRKVDRAKLQQGSQLHVLVKITTAGTAFVASGLVPGCKANVQVKDLPGGGTVDQAKWKFKCSNATAALTTLGLTPQQQAAYQSFFGNSMEAKGKGP